MELKNQRTETRGEQVRIRDWLGTVPNSELAVVGERSLANGVWDYECSTLPQPAPSASRQGRNPCPT